MWGCVCVVEVHVLNTYNAHQMYSFQIGQWFFKSLLHIKYAQTQTCYRTHHRIVEQLFTLCCIHIGSNCTDKNHFMSLHIDCEMPSWETSGISALAVFESHFNQITDLHCVYILILLKSPLYKLFTCSLFWLCLCSLPLHIDLWKSTYLFCESPCMPI